MTLGDDDDDDDGKDGKDVIELGRGCARRILVRIRRRAISSILLSIIQEIIIVSIEIDPSRGKKMSRDLRA
jgi:hypothetical protein